MSPEPYARICSTRLSIPRYPTDDPPPRSSLSAYQAFHRFWSESLAAEPDERFQFFLEKVLPQYRDSQMSHTMLLVPSYFDFVRIRNHFIKETVNFVQVCEYTKVCLRLLPVYLVFRLDSFLSCNCLLGSGLC